MGRHYSAPKRLLRQIPNALLARYFHARGPFGDLDFSALKESQPDTLFAAWLTLPDHQRSALDAECQEIFEMSCEKGFRAILDEAQWHLAHEADAHVAFVEELAVLSNQFERAMVTFFDHGQADPFANSGGVYELLDTIAKSLPLNLYNVTQVELAASVVTDANRPSKTVTRPSARASRTGRLGERMAHPSATRNDHHTAGHVEQ